MEKDRLDGKVPNHDTTLLQSLHSKLQFTSRQGAEVVLNAALLGREEVYPGEFVLPYFFGFSSIVSGGNSTNELVPYWMKVTTTIAYEQYLQTMTYKKGHMWVCPASVESRDMTLQHRFREVYLQHGV